MNLTSNKIFSVALYPDGIQQYLAEIYIVSGMNRHYIAFHMYKDIGYDFQLQRTKCNWLMDYIVQQLYIMDTLW